jgi:hypothetical protein
MNREKRNAYRLFVGKPEGNVSKVLEIWSCGMAWPRIGMSRGPF